MREIAIIKNHNVDIQKNIIDMLPENSSVTVFMTIEDKSVFESSKHKIQVVRFPVEMKNEFSKLKNLVSKHFFDQNFKGCLHVIEDNVLVFNDPTAFMDGIDEMMCKMKMKSWLNTVTDTCNYTFFQYNPRISVDIDKEDAKERYNKTIYWTSHSNTSWTCFNYEYAQFGDVRFNEDFQIPMYFIIQFLADRRNHKKPGEPYFMNFYPTIKEERNVFKNINVDGSVQFTREQFMKEDEHFKNLNINHDGDASIEDVIQSMYDAIMK